MTSATTSAPTTGGDDTPEPPRPPATAGDPFDHDVLPTPRARPAPSCAPCSPR